MSASWLIDRGLLPDAWIRRGIRRLLLRRLQAEDRGSPEANARQVSAYAAALGQGPIAIQPRAANAQHYEVPAEFFRHVLGRHMKYSSGLWDPPTRTLDEAEQAMLELTVERAQIQDGMDVLDLGCGWGSLTLYLAARFPACRIVSLSNSHSQREFILERCRERGLSNVKVVTDDVSRFSPPQRFDRVVSIEMFEHMHNYAELLRRIGSWLRPDGRLFVHIFVHRQFAYPFETRGSANWLGRHFFTGGQMPSADLLGRFDEHMRLVHSWEVSGLHYARTARAWLQNLDAARAQALSSLARSDNPVPARVQLRRWRVFFMACEELWAFREGTEWHVQHYLFEPLAPPGSIA